jgi:AcrR family transcriptional regulator
MNKPVKSDGAPPRSPGRPRDPKLREKILAAAANLIEEAGIGAVTMEAVAARAGVGKPTVYRSWPNREALTMAALMATAVPQQEVRATVSAMEDLRLQLRRVVDVFTTPRGRSVVLMTASADPDSELGKAFRNHVMLASREEGRALLERAIGAGELRSDLPIDVVLDMIYGAIFYRLLIGHAPVGRSLTDAVIDTAVRGWAA